MTVASNRGSFKSELPFDASSTFLPIPILVLRQRSSHSALFSFLVHDLCFPSLIVLTNNSRLESCDFEAVSALVSAPHPQNPFTAAEFRGTFAQTLGK